MAYWQLEYLTSEAVLRVRVDGIVRFDDMTKIRRDLLDAAKAHGCTRFLIDYTQAALDLSTAEYYQVPDASAADGVDRSWRFAVVVRTIDADMEFFETTTLNRGFVAKVFTDEAFAKGWLARPERWGQGTTSR